MHHAATQLGRHDPPTALRFFRRAYALQPTTRNGRALALFLLLEGDAREALSIFERHLDDDGERFAYLEYAARAAFTMGDDEKTVAYAEELIARAPNEAGFDFVEGQHQGHVLIGRVALRRGDVDGARRALLAAADAPRHFAEPNMTLADELSARGEVDVVETFLARTTPR